MIKVSVIVPIYKVEKYLNKCIDSILDQTFKNFELILVNDGSPDRCGAICDECAKNDNRIIVIHKENGGVSAARNAGVEIARGEYIMFVDGDDFLENNCLELLVKASDDGNIDLVAGGYNAIDFKPLKNKLISTPNELYDGEMNTEEFMRCVTDVVMGEGKNGSVFLVPWAKLYKTALVKENCIRFMVGVKHVEDTIFNIEFYQQIKKVSCIKACIYNYNRAVFGAATRCYEEKYFDISLVVMEKYRDWLSGTGLKDWLNRYYIDRIRETIKHFSYHCNVRQAAEKIKISYEIFEKEYKKYVGEEEIYNMFGGKYKDLIKEKKWIKFVKLWKFEHLYSNSKKKLKQITLKAFEKGL